MINHIFFFFFLDKGILGLHADDLSFHILRFRGNFIKFFKFFL